MTRRVLVIEDDELIASEVQRALDADGCATTVARTGRAGIEAVRNLAPDLVVLDLGLPDIDGVEVCRQLRSEADHMPIVMVTARDDDVDIVLGLDAGATDYVVKPFTMAVLLARVRAQLRHRTGATAREVRIGPLLVDKAGHRTFIDGVEVALRPKEYALLVALVDAAGQVVTRDRLLRDVWDLRWETSTKTLEMHVHALRRKLGDRPNGEPWITTMRSVGYRFELA